MISDQDIREAVGIVDPASTVFVKQYGERRTGTNAVRALLTLNFTNLFVLMHILGDKHSAPVDLDALQRSVGESADASWQFTWQATYSVPSDTTHLGNFPQTRFLKAMHAPLFRAFVEQRFFRVLSVRNPYDWAAGLLTYQAWPSTLQPGTWEHEAAADRLLAACHAFNEKHTAWLAMHRAHQPRAFIVSAERLRHAWCEVLTELACGMNLTRRCEHEPFMGISRPVRPSTWDFVRSLANEEWLDTTVSRPALKLTEPLHLIVTRSIDWGLMAPLGYLPQPFS